MVASRSWVVLTVETVSAVAGAIGLLLVRVRCAGDTSYDAHGEWARRSWSCQALGGGHPAVAWAGIALVAAMVGIVLVAVVTGPTSTRRRLDALR